MQAMRGGVIRVCLGDLLLCSVKSLRVTTALQQIQAPLQQTGCLLVLLCKQLLVAY